jgi:hypothetical protein
LDNNGDQGNLSSYQPSISADGRYVAFRSYASNLVADDRNRVSDVFVRDLHTSTTVQISWGNKPSYEPSISADGQYVAFISEGRLVGSDKNDLPDVFRVHRSPTTTTLIGASSPSIYGQSVRFTAAVTSGGVPVTEGTVTLQEGDVPLGTSVLLDARGQAEFSVSTLSAGGSPHTITAVYNGNWHLLASVASASQTVRRAPLTVIADQQVKRFDGQPFIGFTVYYVGIVNWDYAISGAASFGGAAVSAIEPGNYTIIPAIGTLAASNYEFTAFVNGTLTIFPADFGDAPNSYNTLAANEGPWHVLSNGLHLGATVDMDVDGQPGVEASDDRDDGVMFTSVLKQGQTARVRVIASQAGGKLDGFLDFNADGDFNDLAENIFHRVPLSAGENDLSFAVPAGATSAPTYARFRISSQGTWVYFGYASDGEVEDYRVTIGLTATSTVQAEGRYQLDAFNFTPGGVVVFAYGTQLGPNPSPAFSVTLGLTDPVYVAQGIADPTGHARALLTLPAALAGQPVYYQAFEQGPNPQASRVNPLTAAALLAMPSGGAGEASGEFPASAVATAGGDEALDVNGDGAVTPLDVLFLINFLNQQASDRAWSGAAVFPPPSYDVNGDGAVSPLDVLNVVNRLNALPLGAAEGEAGRTEAEGEGGASLFPSCASPYDALAGRPRRATPAPLVLPPGTRQAIAPTALATASHAGSADTATDLRDLVFGEPDLPGSPLDAILSAIVLRRNA